ncbi:PAS domain-containing sensor histidine kinase [Reichenbachiella carrageenanivorans]|uniref:histidine kinase n=1 Tax=Reichenbachiella carrageenanivorans TaxID=2979869 RepID=A0ABY6CXB0_9BACT|nr:PAS domain-containing sensor histidine kinase [Reichenbachiella carrageenanivorans]UXX78354.1 PAS domain-containing sensor histidine kinase [Reichenbachiella carrageenanivorans]
MSEETIKEVFDIIVNMEVVKAQKEQPQFDEEDASASIVDALNIVSVALEDRQVEIDNLKETNKELLLSLQEVSRYQSALDISSIVSIGDKDGNIMYANDMFCQISGYTKEEVLGKNHNILKSGEHKRVFWDGMWQIISQGNIWHNEIMNLNKEGIGYWVDTTIVPFFNSSGKIVSYLSMGHDITKRKIQEEEAKEYHVQLESINKNLEQFAHTVSHDLKSPLNNAKGLVSIIESSLGDDQPAEVQEYLILLKKTNDKMRSLIDGILQYSKASGREATLARIALEPFIQEVADTLTAKGQAKLVFKNALPEISYNETVLKQVISNLMSNAIKFNDKEQCVIEFSSRMDDHYYHLSVTDNGPGVRKEDQENMFKLFNKVNQDKTKDSSGVGLATVKKIVNEAGGNIWVKSTLGVGTTFTFTVRIKPKVHW